MSASDALPELAVWVLVGARVAPSGFALALATRGAVPLWLGFALTLALSVGLASGVPPPVLSDAPRLGIALTLGVALLRELCIGLCFASAALVPFFALDLGVRLVERRAPSERAPLSVLYGLGALALVLSLGGLRAYVSALSRSLSVLPLAAAPLARAGLLGETQRIVAEALSAALALALPLLLAVWLLDLSLALVLRVADARASVEALPLRRALVLLLLGLCCAPWVSRVPELTRAALSAAHAALIRLAA